MQLHLQPDHVRFRSIYNSIIRLNDEELIPNESSAGRDRTAASPVRLPVLPGQKRQAKRGVGLTVIPFQVTLQQRTPEAYTGRVTGTVTSLTSMATVIGPLYGGLLVTAFGPAPAFIFSGTGILIVALVFLSLKNNIMRPEKAESASAGSTSANVNAKLISTEFE
ncbi:MFS transporter [Paenibacillus sp. NEAU-GSW1]|uniref:MFS transporter n=1 Tax=Paenibacillus sp. NEAU-GSW1 TaxID=2682486 RepID=UPI0012E1BEE2|nr:MFS transporter [Paenibacillus sp. NEAU-GSW1]MUT68004.1 hypothetical protein [Paenibacillus sp. NEAU-GSW1]